jgi:hypothetical protein
MAVPIPYLTNIYCGKPAEEDVFCQGRCAVDTLIFITALVVGILGLTGVISMPLAAASALIGISVAYIPLWIAAMASIACKPS